MCRRDCLFNSSIRKRLLHLSATLPAQQQQTCHLLDPQQVHCQLRPPLHKGPPLTPQIMLCAAELVCTNPMAPLLHCWLQPELLRLPQLTTSARLEYSTTTANAGCQFHMHHISPCCASCRHQLFQLGHRTSPFACACACLCQLPAVAPCCRQPLRSSSPLLPCGHACVSCLP